jgi:large conductance mechanosensitive channel
VTNQDAFVTKLLRDLKRFLFRGNVMDLAVAVVIGTAFTAVVKALVADILTPIIAAIFGAHNFGQLKFTIHGSTFAYGDFINNVITFLTVAAAMFFLVVTPINWLMARRAQEDPDTKQCPECDSAIPVKARRCPECTSQLETDHRPAAPASVGPG